MSFKRYFKFAPKPSWGKNFEQIFKITFEDICN